MFLPPFSFKISIRDTSFHISLNSLGLYLLECLLNLWCSHSPKIYSIYHFYSCPSAPLKTLGRIFWKSVSPKTERVEEAMICSIKIQSKNMKMTWNISLFTFCMICNFSKCDDFSLQFCKYLSNQIVWYYVYYLFFATMVIWH